MAIRIDSLEQGPVHVLRMAGSLTGPDVLVLRNLIARQGLPDRIDLSDLEFVDEEGVGALLGLEDRGAILVGAEPFVELLLRSRPSSPQGQGTKGEEQ